MAGKAARKTLDKNYAIFQSRLHFFRVKIKEESCKATTYYHAYRLYNHETDHNKAI